MQRLTQTIALSDEKKRPPETNLQDLPLNVTSTIKLFIDIIIFSKFYFKNRQDPKLASDIADTLISELSSLEAKHQKRDTYYITMVKADLFPSAALTTQDREGLHKFGFSTTLKQGEYLPFFLKHEKIYQYINQHIDEKYQDKLKQIINRASSLAIIGCGSYNLLSLRKKFDKKHLQSLENFDPANMIDTEKNSILLLLEEILQLQTEFVTASNTTFSIQQITHDIDQISRAFESRECEYIKKKSNFIQQKLSLLIPALLKNKIPLTNLELEDKNSELAALVRRTKSQEQLIKEIEEIEIKQAYVIAEIFSQQKQLKKRAEDAENKMHELTTKYFTELKKSEDVQSSLVANNKLLEASNKMLEANNQMLKESLQTANEMAIMLNKELNRDQFKKWYYSLALVGLVVGGALCATGGGLLMGAPIIGISSVILGALILICDISFIAYNIYQRCKSSSYSPRADSLLNNKKLHTQILLPALPQNNNQPILEEVISAPTPFFQPTLISVDKKPSLAGDEKAQNIINHRAI